jgi:hypothetical protein
LLLRVSVDQSLDRGKPVIDALRQQALSLKGVKSDLGENRHRRTEHAGQRLPERKLHTFLGR